MNSKTLIGIYTKITLMLLRHEMYALKSITIFISVLTKLNTCLTYFAITCCCSVFLICVCALNYCKHVRLGKFGHTYY